MKTWKEIGAPAIVLLVICLVMTALLAYTNQLTAPIIADLAVETANQAKQMVLPQADAFAAEQQLTHQGTSYTYSQGLDAAGNPVGFVILSSSKGYGGDIVLMTGIDAAGNITGVEILAQSETPGLGTKTQNPDFLHQFVGQPAKVMATSSASGQSAVQAISGATISSSAVKNAVGIAAEIYLELKEAA